MNKDPTVSMMDTESIETNMEVKHSVASTEWLEVWKKLRHRELA